MSIFTYLSLSSYAYRLAGWERAAKHDVYRPASVSVEATLAFYYDPIYRPDGSRRTEP